MAKGKLVGVHILYIMAVAAVEGPFYVSIIYCLMVVGKYPFLSLHGGGGWNKHFGGKLLFAIKNAVELY